MITRSELRDICKKTTLHLYQQEKDYLIKLFLFNYFRRYDGAVFKGGTCLRYLYGTERFSEDIDLNLTVSPERFKDEVKNIMGEFEKLGIENGFIKEELFEGSYTCEIWFHGPLYEGTNQTQNKFRVDAGKRGGTLLEPKWTLIDSQYPETRKKFLVQVMDESELFAEKLITLLTRSKGRDLYDVWFLLRSGKTSPPGLIQNKLKMILQEYGIKDEFSWNSYPSEREYTGDMERLALNIVPYSQVKTEVKSHIEDLRNRIE